MISATMIVRDEEAFLPECLASLRGVVDEIVIVDTGSRDRSREIARDFGVVLVDFAWIGDFSAARNVAIDHARHDWLLYIDADERVVACDRALLHAQLADPALLSATVRFRPRTGFTCYREHRLVRRDPRIRFRGAMHESFRADVDRLVALGEGHIGAADLAIDHVGYDGDQSHKLMRNLTLLQKQIPLSPRRAYLRWHLGTVLRDLGQPAEAERAWAEGARLALADPNPPPDAALCAIELAKLALLEERDPEPYIADGLAVHPGNWMLLWLRAKAWLKAGDRARATPIFEALAAVDGATLVDRLAYDQRIFGAGPLAELAEHALQQGSVSEASTLFARAAALAQRPGPER
jgi:hypothetical protein